MLTELRFVQGAVAKKGIVPEMTHFAIENGVARGYNGTIALCAPVPGFTLAAKPKASALVAALARCKTEPELSITPAGRLSVKSGSFKAFVECIDGPTPHVEPTGEFVSINGNALLNAINAIEKFISTDASRPWSTGILLRDNFAFATNNVCLAQYDLGVKMPVEINLPAAALAEMRRIGEAPLRVQVCSNSATFHYSGNRWLRTQLLDTTWPDLGRVLNRPANLSAIDMRIFEGLDCLRPFVSESGKVFLEDGEMFTHRTAEGGKFSLPSFKGKVAFRLEMLELLNGTATKIDFDAYPAPCIFEGNGVRGAIVGMK